MIRNIDFFKQVSDEKVPTICSYPTINGNLFITEVLEKIDFFDQDKISMANLNGVFLPNAFTSKITVKQFNPVEQNVTKCVSVFASVTTLIKFEFGRAN